LSWSLIKVLEFDAGWGVAARTHFIISSLFCGVLIKELNM